MRRLVTILALTLVAAGCAGRRQVAIPVVPASPRVDDLSSLIRHGCYRCLKTAFAEAEGRHLRQLAFEAAALLVLRSKELGLPSDIWLGRARAFASGDDASSLYLSIVAAVPGDRLSDDREAMLDVKGRLQARASLTMWREALQNGPASEAFRAYLDIAVVCAFGTLTQTDRSFSGPLDPVAETPLYRYRVGICDNTHAARLAALRAGDADFVDADFALGRYALEDPVNLNQEEGLRRLESAAAAFPRSPAIATTIGNLHRAWEEWSAALAAYDRAIAVSPNHPEALVGRAISLSRLSRSHEAIETATRLIDGGQWHLGEAYYWRAWNYLLLKDYEMARRDADRAVTLMSNAAVFTLSGAVEWRLRRLESAEKEFQRALTIDLGECEAAFDLGVVRDDLGKLREALAAFVQARQCYELSMTLRREAIAKVHAGLGTEASKARAVILHQRALEDLEVRYADVLRALGVLDKA